MPPKKGQSFGRIGAECSVEVWFSASDEAPASVESDSKWVLLHGPDTLQLARGFFFRLTCSRRSSSNDPKGCSLAAYRR